MGENRGRPRPGSVAGPASGARLVIHLLGEAEVSFEGRLLPDLTTPRMQRMLALLALASGARLRRDRVAYQLWPDSNEAQARTNLRKLLHDLRRPFAKPDDFLEVGGQAIGWNPDGLVWVDVVAFTDALSRGDATAAVRHYGGDLLPACYDDWLTAEREAAPLAGHRRLDPVWPWRRTRRGGTTLPSTTPGICASTFSMSPPTAC